jgi:hypothetical protein
MVGGETKAGDNAAAYFIVCEPDGGLRGIPTTAFEPLEVLDGQVRLDPADP